VNGFRKLQERLTEEGWFVGWNLPCCQSCAWAELPFEFEDGSEVDLDKVLFNHSQDCEVYIDGEECPECCGDGCDEEGEDCLTCFGKGEVQEGFDPSEYDTSVDGFICNSPEQQSESCFCFSGDDTGVENLKAILPIIEECGCKIHWNGKGDTRPEISWEL
jgi:hypothetical protein